MDNFRNIFKCESIPTSNQTKNILDGVKAKEFNKIYDYMISRLKEKEALEEFTILDGSHLIALDGTEYHSSEHIKCKNCNSRKHKGRVTYYHSMLASALVSNKNKRVMPLIAEYITPQDGHDKQDCENAAIKRWLINNGKRYRDLNPTILGDDLLSRQPICESILKEGYDYISM